MNSRRDRVGLQENQLYRWTDVSVTSVARAKGTRCGLTKKNKRPQMEHIAMVTQEHILKIGPTKMRL